jgi:hypothetical protein
MSRLSVGIRAGFRVVGVSRRSPNRALPRERPIAGVNRIIRLFSSILGLEDKRIGLEIHRLQWNSHKYKAP